MIFPENLDKICPICNNELAQTSPSHHVIRRFSCKNHPHYELEISAEYYCQWAKLSKYTIYTNTYGHTWIHRPELRFGEFILELPVLFSINGSEEYLTERVEKLLNFR